MDNAGLQYCQFWYSLFWSELCLNNEWVQCLTHQVALCTGGGPLQQVNTGAIRNRLHYACEEVLVFRTVAQACPLLALCLS